MSRMGRGRAALPHAAGAPGRAGRLPQPAISAWARLA
jgi:hypothetical protein